MSLPGEDARKKHQPLKAERSKYNLKDITCFNCQQKGQQASNFTSTMSDVICYHVSKVGATIRGTREVSEVP